MYVVHPYCLLVAKPVLHKWCVVRKHGRAHYNVPGTVAPPVEYDRLLCSDCECSLLSTNRFGVTDPRLFQVGCCNVIAVEKGHSVWMLLRLTGFSLYRNNLGVYKHRQCIRVIISIKATLLCYFSSIQLSFNVFWSQSIFADYEKKIQYLSSFPSTIAETQCVSNTTFQLAISHGAQVRVRVKKSTSIDYLWYKHSISSLTFVYTSNLALAYWPTPHFSSALFSMRLFLISMSMIVEFAWPLDGGSRRGLT